MEQSKLNQATIHSGSGYDCFLQLPDEMNVYDASGKKIQAKILSKDK